MIAAINQKEQVLQILLNQPELELKKQVTKQADTNLFFKIRSYGYNGNDSIEQANSQDAFITEAVNIYNLTKMTPLHAACLSGNKQIVQILIQKGAKQDAQDNVSTDYHALIQAEMSNLILTI